MEGDGGGQEEKELAHPSRDDKLPAKADANCVHLEVRAQYLEDVEIVENIDYTYTSANSAKILRTIDRPGCREVQAHRCGCADALRDVTQNLESDAIPGNPMVGIPVGPNPVETPEVLRSSHWG